MEQNLSPTKQPLDQSGSIIPLFAMFSTAFLSLLLFAVDGYMRIQARLEVQNLGEYLSLAALHGFYEPVMDDNDFVERNANLLAALQESQGDNSVTGLWSSGTGWNFSGTTCSCNSCSGNGWKIDYGYYDTISDSFTKVNSMDPHNPNLCDTTLINAILLETSIPSNSRLISFFSNNNNDSQGNSTQIRTSSISVTYTVGTKRIYRTMKKSASGNAMDSNFSS